MPSAVLERDTQAPATTTRRRAPVKALLLAGIALAAAACGGRYGYDWWTTGRFVETTDDAYVGGDVTTIAPHVAGFVAEIPVADNQPVKAGTVLLRLDPRDFEAALAHAEAVVRERDATLASLKAQVMLQQAQIRQADADVAAHTAQAAFATADARRYAALAQTSYGTEQQAQKSRAADQQARADVAAAAAALDAQRQRLAVLDTQIQAAEAMAAQARADLATARLNLGYTEIRSPIDGTVANRAARVGAYVAQGAYLVSVVPARGLWVDANFKEDQLARMAPGQPATLVADAAPGRAIHGRVVSLAAGTGAVFAVIPPENATGNFTKIVQRVPVRVALDDADAALGRLRPGLSVTVAVDTRGTPGGRPEETRP